jgi:hypothetical protein
MEEVYVVMDKLMKVAKANSTLPGAGVGVGVATTGGGGTNSGGNSSGGGDGK